MRRNPQWVAKIKQRLFPEVGDGMYRATRKLPTSSSAHWPPLTGLQNFKKSSSKKGIAWGCFFLHIISGWFCSWSHHATILLPHAEWLYLSGKGNTLGSTEDSIAFHLFITCSHKSHVSTHSFHRALGVLVVGWGRWCIPHCRSYR